MKVQQELYWCESAVVRYFRIVVWVLIPCLVGGYQRFFFWGVEGPAVFRLQGTATARKSTRCRNPKTVICIFTH